MMGDGLERSGTEDGERLFFLGGRIVQCLYVVEEVYFESPKSSTIERKKKRKSTRRS